MAQPDTADARDPATMATDFVGMVTGGWMEQAMYVAAELKVAESLGQRVEDERGNRTHHRRARPLFAPPHAGLGDVRDREGVRGWNFRTHADGNVSSFRR